MNRRDLFSLAPLALVSPAFATAPQTDRDRIVRVIEQLETYQGWEPSNVVAAKAFAAWQIRKALGLNLPDPRTAQMHVDYQRQGFEQYRRSYWFERDTAEGKVCEIAPMERVLA